MKVTVTVIGYSINRIPNYFYCNNIIFWGLPETYFFLKSKGSNMFLQYLYLNFQNILLYNTIHNYLLDLEKFYVNVNTPNCPVVEHLGGWICGNIWAWAGPDWLLAQPDWMMTSQLGLSLLHWTGTARFDLDHSQNDHIRHSDQFRPFIAAMTWW